MAAPDAAFWGGRRVLVTGHTGIKGAWLVLWLRQLGAAVTGFALDPPTDPSLFAAARVGEGMDDLRGDVRDPTAVIRAFEAARPEVVIHMAAQPLVRRSFQEPLATYETNVMGTVHVLEALRASPDARAAVVVTSDKCYEPRADGAPCREDDPLGGPVQVAPSVPAPRSAVNRSRPAAGSRTQRSMPDARALSCGRQSAAARVGNWLTTAAQG